MISSRPKWGELGEVDIATKKRRHSNAFSFRGVSDDEYARSQWSDTNLRGHAEDVQTATGVQLGLKVQNGLLNKDTTVDLYHVTRRFESGLLLSFKCGAGG
jgi:hypothetical protein